MKGSGIWIHSFNVRFFHPTRAARAKRNHDLLLRHIELGSREFLESALNVHGIICIVEHLVILRVPPAGGSFIRGRIIEIQKSIWIHIIANPAPTRKTVIVYLVYHRKKRS